MKALDEVLEQKRIAVEDPEPDDDGKGCEDSLDKLEREMEEEDRDEEADEGSVP